MKFRTLIGLLAVLIVFSCNQQASDSGQEIEDEHIDKLEMKTGLKIEYKSTRGMPYIDPLGTEYGFRSLPATITNDSTIPIHIEIAFLKEYDYPIANNDEQFKVFPMPEMWAQEGGEVTDSMLMEIPIYLGQPFVNKTLKPGEEWLLSFGTLYSLPENYGAFPVGVFSHDNRDLRHECESLVDQNKSSIPYSAIELGIGYTKGRQDTPDSCKTILCGQISYPEQ